MKHFDKYQQYVKELGGMSYNQFVRERCEGPEALVVGDIFASKNKKVKQIFKIETINYAKRRCFVDCFDKDTGKFSYDGVMLGSELLDPNKFTNITENCEVNLQDVPMTPEKDILWDHCM